MKVKIDGYADYEDGELSLHVKAKIPKKDKVPMKDIFIAARTGDIDTLKQAYADYGNLDMIDESDAPQWRCAHFAASYGSLDVLKFLWECDCKLDTKNSYGNSPAYYAIWSDHLACLKFLHDKLDLSSEREELLNCARCEKSNRCINFLIGLEKKDKVPPHKVFEAAKHGDIDTLKQAYADYGNLDMFDDSNKWTLAHHAALNGNLASLEYLHELGGFLDLRNIAGETPANFAAYGNRLECLKFLYKKLERFNTKDNEGRDLLTVALNYHSNDCVTFLNKLRHAGEI